MPLTAPRHAFVIFLPTSGVRLQLTTVYISGSGRRTVHLTGGCALIHPEVYRDVLRAKVSIVVLYSGSRIFS